MLDCILSNKRLTDTVLQHLKAGGVLHYCVCPGSRNSPFVEALIEDPACACYFWPEERSAAFFALGKARSLKEPVAVLVTSGSAAGELLPACMEAFYTSTPLLLITADRPKRFSGSGAPQAVEQEGLFGVFTPTCLFASDDFIEDFEWDFKAPAHLNIYYEDPQCKEPVVFHPADSYDLPLFLERVNYPAAIVGSLEPSMQESVETFLSHLQIPVYLEGHSGLRGSVHLSSQEITCPDLFFESAKAGGYEIDGVLRLGGVPTIRFWRDLDDKYNHLPVLSISHYPFRGNVHGSLVHTADYRELPLINQNHDFKKWKLQDCQRQSKLQQLCNRFPKSEPGMLHALSKLIPQRALVYLGNSLPIREWDLTAVRNQFTVYSSRGACGIDGQISTFLGLAKPGQENWGIVGDLTALYDLAGFWALHQLQGRAITLVVINNGGGKIFSRMYAYPHFQNQHTLQFEPIAKFWNCAYDLWHEVPKQIDSTGHRLIELQPDPEQTTQFWNAWLKN